VGYQGGGRGEDHGGDYRGHDNLAAWYFESETGEPRLDRPEFEQAKTMFYQRMGWHATRGGVTRQKLEALGQPEVADGLAALGLLTP
jgi:aldehyde:ferredoxin oxidoreductase